MNILFAEDDDLLRNSLTFYLKNNGFTVTPVSNGLEVKDQLKMTPFDLIITDLNMPFFGGMEVINFVRNELKSSAPIIVLTSFGVENTFVWLRFRINGFFIGTSDRGVYVSPIPSLKRLFQIAPRCGY